jgi:hypothetical protein
MREHLVVPSIGSTDVACAEWPNVRRFEHFLQLLNLVDDAFNVHAFQSSIRKPESVKREPHFAFLTVLILVSQRASARN